MLIFPYISGKYYIKEIDFIGLELMAFRLPLVAFIHSAMTPNGYSVKILVYIYFET
jgi:hypothetical protein